ncbi:thioredoxin-like protein [Stachybotrys elegans]|uniref:thioredoxin-dependent peroxiredoxin n=1 Tax=Stachybotrys elegans TaxID=80388 RepID=A0A8K0SYS1_9HYPO|nr:thioredoxin-like protein [Stachybotrys elegans]
MPVELRKRKAREPPAPAPAPKKATAKGKAAKAGAKVKDAVKGAKKEQPKEDKAAAKKEEEAPAAAEEKKPAEEEEKPAAEEVAVGNTITLEGFGGEIETNDGKKTTLKALVEESKAGVVIFTYPRASTPGCTNQACMFRDSYEPLTAGGLAIYGLSTDSPKANTNFKEKQKLPYPLLCDPSATLLAAIGLRKTAKSALRGVFAVDKDGKVLLATPGGPAATVDAVRKLVEEMK